MKAPEDFFKPKTGSDFAGPVFNILLGLEVMAEKEPNNLVSD